MSRFPCFLAGGRRMASHRVPSSGLAPSLLVAVLALVAGGCGSSDRSDLGSTASEGWPETSAAEAAVAEAPAAEPAPSAEQEHGQRVVTPPESTPESAVASPEVGEEPAAAPSEAGTEPAAFPPGTESGEMAPPREMPSPGEGPDGAPRMLESDEPAPAEKPPAQGIASESADASPPANQPGTLASDPSPDRLDGPRLGVNPLREGNGPSSGHRPVSVRPASIESRRRESRHVEMGNVGKKGEDGEVPFDPIKENGPIFEGWPKPKWALMVSGRQDGYLEPCGCAGLDRMKGGMSRRYSMLEQLREERGWPVAAVDVGGLVKGFGAQANLKFQMSVNVMLAMGYDAIGIGKRDLQLGVDGLVSGPFVSANVALFGFDFQPGLTPRQRIVEVGGVELGITSILGAKWQREINNSDVEMADPKAKLAEIVPAMEKECDVLLLLAHATREESIELARQFPQFPLVVTAGGPPEPPAQPERIDGSNALLIEVGEKGMNAVVLAFYDDAAQPIRYQRVPLDSRFPQSDYVKKEMSLYQEGLKDAGLAGLEVTPVSYPGQGVMGKFVGTAKCKSCHEDSYKVWKKSGHAKAWQTLVEVDPPRNFDPECIACHVVGWTPQNYRPLESGFLSEKETPHLIDVGCETCHGPGEKHVAAEMGADFDRMEKQRKPTVMTLEEAQQAVSSAISDRQHCMNCHDIDNSPDFHFETYWPKIEHHEE